MVKLVSPVTHIVGVLLIVLTTYSNALNILFVTFISTGSHMITFKALLEELAIRGHNVTVLSPHKSNQIPTPNYREILTLDAEEFISQFMPDYRKLNKTGVVKDEFKTGELIQKACEMTYDLPQVRRLLSDPFDVIILPSTINSCAAGYVYKFNTTLILASLVTAYDWIQSPVGGIFNSFFGRTNFLDKFSIFMEQTRFSVMNALYFKPAATALYRKKLKDPTLPPVDEIFSNASLILSNSHFSVDIPRPLLPDVIPVLGMHCRNPKPLPSHLENFVNSGDQGFILFSMGSGLNGNSISEETTQMLINVFSKLEELVVWKWEGNHLEELPQNVKQFKWLPQQDLLGHSKIKGFVTQGGYLSITEAIYHGVPLLGIPIVADQFLNMERVEEFEIGITLNFNQLSEDALGAALQSIINDPRYKESMTTRSKVFRDQPMAPLDQAIYWIEYVARHGGAQHLKSASRDLNIFQLNSLDIFGSLILAVILIICATYFSILSVVQKFRHVFESEVKAENKKVD